MNAHAPNASIRFFDEQFRRQISEHEFRLNPFELSALSKRVRTMIEAGG